MIFPLTRGPGGSGLLVCRLDNWALAAEKESRLLLYQDLDSDLDNLSCSDRLAKAHFTGKNQEHNQTIPRQPSPTAWQVLYADRYTCQENAVIPSHADLSFTVLLFNADSAGNPLEHFSAEEAGQTFAHCGLIFLCNMKSCTPIEAEQLRLGERTQMSLA
uniref:GPR180-like N-terminal domain-containing protein n=1 Tax=Acanthochromis polyacanthus TaxID=80966 RepID=A0A3Q1GQP2_9TELE